MKARTWGIVGAVVVLAAAGTATALLLHKDKGNYTSLPTCDQLSKAVPGKPAFHVGQNVTAAADIHGLHPAYTNIRCETADNTTVVEVDLYQPSDMDVVTLNKYPDKQVHDGAWRANQIFRRNNLYPLRPGIAYGTLGYDNSTCTVEQVKGNADVMLTVPLPKTTSLEQFKAQCAQVAQQQMPKVIDAVL